MNETQAHIIRILQKNKSVYNYKSLRAFGKIINVPHPQNIKYHFQKLEENGYITIDIENTTLYLVKARITADIEKMELEIMIRQLNINKLNHE